MANKQQKGTRGGTNPKETVFTTVTSGDSTSLVDLRRLSQASGPAPPPAAPPPPPASWPRTGQLLLATLLPHGRTPDSQYWVPLYPPPRYPCNPCLFVAFSNIVPIVPVTTWSQLCSSSLPMRATCHLHTSIDLQIPHTCLQPAPLWKHLSLFMERAPWRMSPQG